MSSKLIKDNRIAAALKLFICTAIYLIWFFMLEQKVTNDYHVIHVGLDDYIPFCEYFIVPYIFWFVYVMVTWAYFFAKGDSVFGPMSRFLFAGMFISLFICTIYPNGTDLRPDIDTDKNVFTALCGLLWGADTPTNVLPSIHVYNSIGICIGVFKSQSFRDRTKVKLISSIICVLICLSTVFLKQHSCADVLAAAILAYGMYQVVYEPVSADELRERMAGRKLLPRRESDI